MHSKAEAYAPKAERATPLRIQLLRAILFPWGLWHLASIFPRRLRREYAREKRLGHLLSYALQMALYCFVALPLTLILIGEGLISINERIIAEQADYRLQSDFAAGTANELVDLPGPQTRDLQPVAKMNSDEYRSYLVRLYSPVIVHKVSHHPEWDIPRFLDFDGNSDPRDNVVNEPKFRNTAAGVYGELTAETEDSYYLTYSLYHVTDYDHPVRQALLRWTYHDNDNEGLHIRVDKETMEVVEVETWFHNRFLLFNQTGVSRGSEPVHGAIHTENDTHVLVYAQPQGHGVRLLQAVDLPSIRENVKIMRYQPEGPRVPQVADLSTQSDVTYELRNFDRWYDVATGPYVTGDEYRGGIFQDSIRIGTDPSGQALHVGRYIAGWDYYVGGWSRPKPMWSWDDGWDDIPILIWHFYPSYSFAAHGGEELSHRYLFNRPIEKIFGEDPNVFYENLDLQVEMRAGNKWEGLEERGGTLDSAYYWAALRQSVSARMKRYINYLFHALG